MRDIALDEELEADLQLGIKGSIVMSGKYRGALAPRHKILIHVNCLHNSEELLGSIPHDPPLLVGLGENITLVSIPASEEPPDLKPPAQIGVVGRAEAPPEGSENPRLGSGLGLREAMVLG